jgi:hypothetical protein
VDVIRPRNSRKDANKKKGHSIEHTNCILHFSRPFASFAVDLFGLPTACHIVSFKREDLIRPRNSRNYANKKKGLSIAHTNLRFFIFASFREFRGGCLELSALAVNPSMLVGIMPQQAAGISSGSKLPQSTDRPSDSGVVFFRASNHTRAPREINGASFLQNFAQTQSQT